MKKFKNILASLATGVMIGGLALSFNACSEQSPFQPDDNVANLTAEALGKTAQDANGKGEGKPAVDEVTYPQSASLQLRWSKLSNGYTGGRMELVNGSMFKVKAGAFTPPKSTKFRRKNRSVTLTWHVDKDETKNEIIYTFGPSGSQFAPPAKVLLSWKDIGKRDGVPGFYYITADGRYIKQKPDHIDKVGKKMMVHIDHFSRYAIGWGD